MRVAFADDSLIIRQQLAVTIRNSGFDVVERLKPWTKEQIETRDICGANDGRELVALCEQTKPDLVLIDLSMGEYGGSTAAQVIAAGKLAGQIVIASSVSAEAARIARLIGCRSLNKPYDKKVLAQLLKGIATGG